LELVVSFTYREIKMVKELGSLRIHSVAKFRISKLEYFLGVIAAVALVGVGVSSILQSQATVEQSKVLSSVESPAASIIFTQRETLAYAIRLAQWGNGGTPRRTVQIARSILAQRLQVVDTSGRSMGSRANQEYWDAIRTSDEILASAPSGILPADLHDRYNEQISPIIDSILAQSRAFVVSYQQNVDRELLRNAQENESKNRSILQFFYLFLFSGGLFLILNVRNVFRNFRTAGEILNQEQEELNQTLDKLQRSQVTVSELQDLNEAKNAFISTVNHELRTPITSIIGYIEVLQEEIATADKVDISKYLEVLDRNAQILLHLVESMLSLSKIDAEGPRTYQTEVWLNEVVDNAIFALRPTTEKKNLTIDFRSTSEDLVLGDAGQLNQVVINLLGNAIKFSHPNTSVEILLDEFLNDDGREIVRLAITDHGIGIPAADVDHLFTRFFRAGNANSGQYPGTGLGLSIVQRVIEHHGGSIKVRSIEGEGSTFTIEIPRLVSSEEFMTLERRTGVLNRAIEALEKATFDEIRAITHEMGGAIGFYGFEAEGQELVEFSRSLLDGEVGSATFTSEKSRLLNLLRQASERIGGSVNG
jgi:signal transduction histidine kinase